MSNHFQNATIRGPKNTETDVWLTPRWIFDRIGTFDLDPCGWIPNGSPIVKTAENYYAEHDDGLVQDWFGSVFVNFPYSQAKLWMDKCKHEYLYNPDVKEIVVLCFARTETKAWQENVKSATGINLIYRRIKFLNSQGIEKGNGNAPSALIAFGDKAYKRIKNIDGIKLLVNN